MHLFYIFSLKYLHINLISDVLSKVNNHFSKTNDFVNLF